MERCGKLPDSSRLCPIQVLFSGKTSSVQALGLWASFQEQRHSIPAGTKAGVWLPEATLPPSSVCRVCRASQLHGPAIRERLEQRLSGD